MAGREAILGEAVQLEPIRLALKAPGTKRLKLKCDILLSTFAFKFNLRRCNLVFPISGPKKSGLVTVEAGVFHSSNRPISVYRFPR